MVIPAGMSLGIQLDLTAAIYLEIPFKFASANYLVIPSEIFLNFFFDGSLDSFMENPDEINFGKLYNNSFERAKYLRMSSETS